jgi:hypothetical protein
MAIRESDRSVPHRGLRLFDGGKRHVVITTINDLHACSLRRRVAPLLLW